MAQSPLRPTFNVELANGSEGYIPPAEQHPLGGYTTWPARTAGLEVGAEAAITEAVLTLLERVAGKKRVPLPAFARGVVVDSGRSLRLLITGTPIGERILDLTLNDAPSFDCWVEGEWIREAVFDDADRAIEGLRRFIEQYLSPKSIAEWEARRAQA